MDIKFRITKYLAVSALAMLLLGACSKNNIYINYPDEENNGGSSGSGNDDNNGNPTKENALITFSASVEGRNITRAMSPMGKGLQSWLCGIAIGAKIQVIAVIKAIRTSLRVESFFVVVLFTVLFIVVIVCRMTWQNSFPLVLYQKYNRSIK